MDSEKVLDLLRGQKIGKEKEVNSKGKVVQTKTRFDFNLLPSVVTLFAIVGVLTEASEKYGKDNWKEIPMEDHYNHAIQHLLQLKLSDDPYEEVLHCVCRLLFILQMLENG